MVDVKILVTLGPRSLNREIIHGMDACGVFLFRINLSHTALKDIEPTIATIRQYTDTPICLDSEGAQIRTGKIAGRRILLKNNDPISVRFDSAVAEGYILSFYPPGIAGAFSGGDILDIDFNGARIQIDRITPDECVATVIKPGEIGENKGVAVNRPISLPAMTEKDRQAIQIGRRLGIKHFALSFAASADDVCLFRQHTGDTAFVISKIESTFGVRNLSEIADAADALLIDRGDLSREVLIEQIPLFQRRIVAIGRSHRKPVYVATNLLETMVDRSEPNRAEVNDVISTLEMGASGVVLAAETAIGNYPLESVKMMRRLIDQFGHWTPNTNFEDLFRQSKR